MVEIDGLMERLAQKDCRSSLPPSYMERLTNILTHIFFLGTLPPIEFYWASFLGPGRYGVTHYGLSSSGEIGNAIFMHPTEVAPGYMLSPASRRLGTLLHEMAHAFLLQFACTSCPTAIANVCGRVGRWALWAWHLLAAAIERAAPDLLEVGHVHLGRLMALQQYYIGDGGPEDPSQHDLERYSFM
jgi:hypothetical protein